MNYKIKTIPYFDKELKRLIRKYLSLKTDFIRLIVKAKLNPLQGDALRNNHNCFKLRLAIKSKGRGKSGGARVIMHIEEDTIHFLSIYDNSESKNIDSKKMNLLLAQIPKGITNDET